MYVVNVFFSPVLSIDRMHMHKCIKNEWAFNVSKNNIVCAVFAMYSCFFISSHHSHFFLKCLVYFCLSCIHLLLFALDMKVKKIEERIFIRYRKRKRECFVVCKCACYDFYLLSKLHFKINFPWLLRLAMAIHIFRRLIMLMKWK